MKSILEEVFSAFLAVTILAATFGCLDVLLLVILRLWIGTWLPMNLETFAFFVVKDYFIAAIMMLINAIWKEVFKKSLFK